MYRVLILIVVAGMALAYAGPGWADIPAPPVNQLMGQFDGDIGEMTEAECRACHDSGVPDRHHMLYPAYLCLDCHGDTFEVKRNCLECHTSSPHHTTDDAVNRQCTACHGDIVDDYDDTHYIPTYAPSLVTPVTGLHGDGWYDKVAGGDHPERLNLGTATLDVAAGTYPGTAGTPDTHASDENRLGLILVSTGDDNDVEVDHNSRYSSGTFTVIVVHGSVGDSPTVVWAADGTDYGELTITIESGVTTANDLVAAINAAEAADDPTPDANQLVGRLYSGSSGPPLYTPEGTGWYADEHYEQPGGEPLNSRGFGAGSCSYCHDADLLDPHVIIDNHDTHHGIDLPSTVKAGTAAVPNPGGVWSKCNVCHDYTGRGGTYHDNSGAGFAMHIRVCEECHGPDSLHNIQVDSLNAGNLGTIVVGGEDAGYGHVGRDAGPGDSDCWGCHGFSVASAPGTGPLVPMIYNSDLASVKSGKDTMVVLTGAAFTNSAPGGVFESEVALCAADGTSTTLTPDLMDQGTIVVTIPAGTAPGSYDLRAVKGDFKSNPAPLSVVPQTVINKAVGDSTVRIRGTGFGGYAEGSEGSFVTGAVPRKNKKRNATRDEVGKIISWTDTKIEVQFSSKPKRVTVFSIFGQGSSKVDAKGRRR